ncbi:hypothetical protein JCM8208_004844 [Rhodotorula glutinis]
MKQADPSFGRGTTPRACAPFRPVRAASPSTSSSLTPRRTRVDPSPAAYAARVPHLPAQLPSLRLSPNPGLDGDFWAGLDLGGPRLDQRTRLGSSPRGRDSALDNGPHAQQTSRAPAASFTLSRSPSPVVTSPYFDEGASGHVSPPKQHARAPAFDSDADADSAPPSRRPSSRRAPLFAAQPPHRIPGTTGASASALEQPTSAPGRPPLVPGSVTDKASRALHEGVYSQSIKYTPSSSADGGSTLAYVSSAASRSTAKSGPRSPVPSRMPSFPVVRAKVVDEGDGYAPYEPRVRLLSSAAGRTVRLTSHGPAERGARSLASAAAHPRHDDDVAKPAPSSAAPTPTTAPARCTSTSIASSARRDVSPASGRTKTCDAPDERPPPALAHDQLGGARHEHPYALSNEPKPASLSTTLAAPSKRPRSVDGDGGRFGDDADNPDLTSLEGEPFLEAPILPIHEQLPPRSGADLLSYLADGGDDAVSRFWRSLPSSIARSPLTPKERTIGVEVEERRLTVVRDFLTAHGVVVPEREFVRPTGVRGARINSFWHYAVPSDELDGHVFNPDASPTFRLVGRVVPLPVGDAFWPNMHDTVAQPKDVDKYKHERQSVRDRPFLATAHISPPVAKDLYGAVADENEQRYLDAAIPPRGALNLGILNGSDVVAEFERSLTNLSSDAAAKGRRVRVVRERIEMAFNGMEHYDKFIIDDCERQQDLIYIEDMDDASIISAFVPLVHASYYFHSGTNAWASASASDLWSSLLADLIRIDNSTTTTTLRHPTLTSPEPVATAAGTSSCPLVPVPATSPLAPHLPTSTASYVYRIQVLNHPDMRTPAEKARQYRKMIETRARKDADRRARGEDTSAETAAKTRNKTNRKRRKAGEKTSDEIGEESRKATDERRVAQGKLTSRQEGAATRNRRRAEYDERKDEAIDGVPLLFALDYLARQTTVAQLGTKIPYLSRTRKAVALVDKVDAVVEPQIQWRIKLAQAYETEQDSWQ